MPSDTSKPAVKTSSAPPPLSRNIISYIGWALTLVVLTIIVVLISADLLLEYENPYNDVVTYLVMPGLLGGSVAVILLGVGWEWRKRHRREPGEYPTLPVLDINKGWQRRRVLVAFVLLALFFTVSAVGTYEAYHFTESPVFCGEVCHHVMEPEYTAYQYSPHARVTCVECHIGSGADWYVKSKMSGLRQVWAVATQSYHLPIETPVANLRPARDTCEECHWPGKFTGSRVREVWHFSPDESNTAMRYTMLMKVGGGEPEVGLGHGIHWHINKDVTVRYWARDKHRLDIPWVEVTVGDEAPRAFRTEGTPEVPPEGAEIRTMDCMDCHNRPSHVYRSPRSLVDSSLATGVLDRSLPYLRRYATNLLSEEYEDTPAALEAIDQTLRKKYASRMQGPRGQALVEDNIEWLQTLYQRNFFPEQTVEWTDYPNHLGHLEFPGCYRCHDGKHVSEEKEPISDDCTICHSILDQAEGQKAFEEAEYEEQPFVHPRNLGDVWVGKNCTDCHGFEVKAESGERRAEEAG